MTDAGVIDVKKLSAERETETVLLTMATAQRIQGLERNEFKAI